MGTGQVSWTRVKGVENGGRLMTISHQPGICPANVCVPSRPVTAEGEPCLQNDNLKFLMYTSHPGSSDDCKLRHLISMINLMMVRTCGECESNYTDGHNMDEVCPIGRYLPVLH